MIYLPENLALDLMTLLIFHHPEERKQTRIPKDTRGGFGEIPKVFLSPNGHPNHHMQLVQYVQNQSHGKSYIPNVAPAKTNSRENKFQISKYQLTSTKLFASTSENTKTNSNHRITSTVSTADPANQILIQ